MQKIIFILLFSTLASAEQSMNRNQSKGVVITALKTTYQEKVIPSAAACSVTKLALLKQDYRASATQNKDISENTGMYAFYQTTNPSCNRDFVFVQFIKGCAIESYKDKLGKWNSNYMLYTLRGKDVDFNMPDWIVDTIDEDPMYSSTAPEDSSDRHYRYATPKSPVALKDSNKLKLFNYVQYPSNSYALGLNQGPQREVIYISDYPTGSDIVFSNGSQLLQNDTVLDFKLCIYKRDDVPVTGNPKRFDVPLNQGGPVSCIDWSSNHIYNRTTKKFTQATDMKNFCKITTKTAKN